MEGETYGTAEELCERLLTGIFGVTTASFALALQVAGQDAFFSQAADWVMSNAPGGPYYMGYSRKRFIKLAMSYGLQRNEAAILANRCRYMAGIDDIPTMISILDEQTRLPRDIVPLWMSEKKERRHWERLAAR